MELSHATSITKNRWAKYALASASSACVLLAPETTVDADITEVYVGTFLEDRTQGDISFDYFGPYTFGASGASFVFRQAFNEFGTDEAGALLVDAYGGLSIAGEDRFGYFYPANLAYGQYVSTAGDFDITEGERGDMAWGQGGTHSQFLVPGLSYLGFRFDVGNGTQYGFAEIDMFGVPDNRATFIGYAWADPGEAISTFSISQIPEPGAIGVLAMGSIGLLAWRKKRVQPNFTS